MTQLELCTSLGIELVDFMGVDFVRVDFMGVDFMGADLVGVDLMGGSHVHVCKMLVVSHSFFFFTCHPSQEYHVYNNYRMACIMIVALILLLGSSGVYRWPLKKSQEERDREQSLQASKQVVSASQQCRVNQVTGDLVQWVQDLVSSGTYMYIHVQILEPPNKGRDLEHQEVTFL